MGESREFCVIEFKDPPVMDLDRYICVPKTWIGRPFEDTLSHSAAVVVKYPLEKQTATRSRVRRYENYDDEWKMFIASVKYNTENYNDAMAYIKLLHKGGYFESRPKENIITSSTDKKTPHKPNQNTPRKQNQSKTSTTGTGLRDNYSSDVQKPSAESPMDQKTETKRNNTGASNNKDKTSDENRTEHESVSENVSILCKTVAQDLKNIKQELMGLFNNFLPIIEKLQNNVSQNTVMLEKIYNLVDKPNRSQIDGTVPTVSRGTQSNHEKGDIGNIAETVEGNNIPGIDDSTASTPKNTTPRAAMKEDEQVETITTQEKPTNAINVPKPHDFTIRSEGKDATVDEDNTGSTGAIPQIPNAPARNGTKKRKLADADANIPMKKRDGPRNPSLQNSETDPVTVECILGTKREFVIVPQNFVTFIHDALKVSLLYKKN